MWGPNNLFIDNLVFHGDVSAWCKGRYAINKGIRIAAYLLGPLWPVLAFLQWMAEYHMDRIGKFYEGHNNKCRGQATHAIIIQFAAYSSTIEAAGLPVAALGFMLRTDVWIKERVITIADGLIGCKRVLRR